MTARSDRERAEQAIIASAVALLEASQYLTFTEPSTDFAGALADLGKAVGDLQKIGLRPIGGVTTNADAPQTAHDAAAWMKRYSSSVGVQVFREIALADHSGFGLTTEQVEQRLKGKHQSISPRVTDLIRKGYVVDSGRRRKTTSGNEAIVWKPTALGTAAAREAWSW